MKKKYCVLLGVFGLTVTIVACGMSGDEGMPSAAGDMDTDGGAGGADLDGDTDGDGDGDADADSEDTDSDDGYPPEKEEEANYMAPQGSGRYVFIADETNDAVVVVDSESLAIDVVEVGSRPTHLVPLSDADDGRVAVMNLDSDEVTLLSVDEESNIEMVDLDVRPDTNVVVPSPDGRYLIAFHDPQFSALSGAPTTDQEISVLRTGEGEQLTIDLSVGMHPWRVAFDQSSKRAFVISEEGINIIDLENLESIALPPSITPFEGGTYDSETVDLEITPDGSLVLARKTGSADLLVAPLEVEPAEAMRTYTLPAVPTDLDISPEGSSGVLVLRSLGQVAVFNFPLPDDPEEDPFTYIDLEDKVAGVATLAPDGNHMLLHTTTAGDEEDKRRITLLSREGDSWDAHSTVLERQIRAVAAGVDSETAIVIHQKVTASANSHPYSYSLIKLPSLQAKFQQAPVEPGQLLLTPDGNYGFLLLRGAKRTDKINLESFIVDSLQLGSPPVAAGYAAQTDKVFIAQDHPAGRMTFIGVRDESVKTVTGYNLNDEIEY